MRKPRAWRWVVNTGTYTRIFVDRQKPTCDDSVWFSGGDHRAICNRSFKAVFGFLPPEGEPVKANFHAELVEAP